MAEKEKEKETKTDVTPGVEKSDDKSTIKIGTFELQTKSFWLSLVSILTLFMTAYFYLNAHFWFKINKEINETNKELIKVVNLYVSKDAK